jgi:NTE family protein
MGKKTGLVLTGGGARGAYQAGVMKGIAEILNPPPGEIPFPIIAGVSAGAINGAFLGAQGSSFQDSAKTLCELWSELKAPAVVKTDFLSLGRIGAKWARELGFGGALGKGGVTHLLDSTPLRELVQSRVDFSQIQRNIQSGSLQGISFTATNYQTGTAVSFFDGQQDIQPWARSARLGRRVQLSADHILASASIPVFFKPVSIAGSFWGDGGVRMSTPLSPAIHLGADRILAVGIRFGRPDELVYQMNEEAKTAEITLADIGGVFLNALFLDALDADMERMQRINQTLELLPPEVVAKHPAKLRKIPLLAIKPSRDLGSLAADQLSKFPFILRHFLRGTGASSDKGWDMISYLAFDSSYTNLLIEVGYEDALKMRNEIKRFFEADAR